MGFAIVLGSTKACHLLSSRSMAGGGQTEVEVTAQMSSHCETGRCLNAFNDLSKLTVNRTLVLLL